MFGLPPATGLRARGGRDKRTNLRRVCPAVLGSLHPPPLSGTLRVHPKWRGALHTTHSRSPLRAGVPLPFPMYAPFSPLNLHLSHLRETWLLSLIVSLAVAPCATQAHNGCYLLVIVIAITCLIIIMFILLGSHWLWELAPPTGPRGASRRKPRCRPELWSRTYLWCHTRGAR